MKGFEGTVHRVKQLERDKLPGSEQNQRLMSSMSWPTSTYILWSTLYSALPPLTPEAGSILVLFFNPGHLTSVP